MIIMSSYIYKLVIIVAFAAIYSCDAFFFERNNITGSNPCYLKYGDMMKLSPTGASWKTARANSLSYNGARASQAIARKSLAAIKSLWPKIKKTADDICIDPALIAGLASRESNVGSVWKNSKCPGWGDCRLGRCKGCRGWGILQCDIKSSGVGKQCEKYKWDSQQLMEFTLDHSLIPNIKAVHNKFPAWKKEQDLQGAVAAYNFGLSNVRSWANLDKGTSNDDYSNDVMARSQWIKHQMEMS